MQFVQVVLNLPDRVCAEFEQALARGTWLNGVELTPAQIAICQEALALRKTHWGETSPTMPSMALH